MHSNNPLLLFMSDLHDKDCHLNIMSRDYNRTNDVIVRRMRDVTNTLRLSLYVVI